MSQSPTGEDGEAGPYQAAWSAISRLIRQGYSWSGRERNCAYLNLGDGSFANVSAASGFGPATGAPDDGRGLVRVDWDLDGDLDLFTTNRSGPRVRYLRNDLGRSRSVAFRLVGTECNSGGIGARVELRLAREVGGDAGRDTGEDRGGSGPVLLRTRRAGEGFLSQSSAWLHFGLGRSTIEGVSVRWPGGALEDFGLPRAGRRYVLVQGTGLAREWSAPGAPAQVAGARPEPPPVTRTARVVMAAKLPMPRLEATSREGRRVDFLGIGPEGPRATGRPLLLNLWASWCAPCAAELAGLAAAEDELRAAGLDVVALSLDDTTAHDSFDALLERTAFPFTAGFVTPQTLEILDILESAVLDRDTRLPVPTSLLIDPTGHLVALYVGPVEAEQILADRVLFELTPDQRRHVAVPFRGRWYREPRKVDLAYFEGEFNRRGLTRTAGEFALGRVEVRRLSEAQLQHEFGVVRTRQERFEDAEQHFRNAVQLDPYYADAYQGLAYCLHRLERWSEAAEAYTVAVRLERRDERSHFNLGLVYLELEDLEGASRQLERLRGLSSSLAPELERRLTESGGR